MAYVPNHYVLYNLRWPKTISPLYRELEMIRRGGQWKKQKGGIAGQGLLYHFKRAEELLWPEKTWHRWNTLELDAYVNHRSIVVIGPASSGKSCSAATNCLVDYYAFPTCTTIIVCSTKKEMLEQRIYGEIKKFHRLAKERYPWLPGNLIESRLRIVTDHKDQAKEGRDFRNGVVGVPCQNKAGFVGLGDFVGVKNKRVRLVGDELSLMPRVFVDSIANLDSNPDFKVYGLGNCKDTTDALGVLAEPHPELGGWEGGIDQQPKTKTWKTRMAKGICVQLVGSDSPNLDGKLGIPLIDQAYIDRQVAFYGRDSLQFTMMCEGRMPRGQGSRRVLTRQLCLKNGAMEQPVWKNNNRTRIGFLDAAFRGVGGDRCIFGEMQFGEESEPLDGGELLNQMVSQSIDRAKPKHILALIDLVLVPISDNISDVPEDQITRFCLEQCSARGISPDNFFFDSGMRSSLVSAMCRIWSTQVCPVDFGGKPSRRPVSAGIDVLCLDYYSKFVSELWYSCRHVVEAGQFRGMTEEVMLEFCSREWKLVGANKTEVETKAEMKTKIGRSPDLADAVVTGIEGARQRGFMIERFAPAREEDPDSDSNLWKVELRTKARNLWHGNALNHSV